MDFIVFDFATPYYDEAIRLRHAILRAPLGMEFFAKDLAKEFDQFHIGAWLPDGTLAAVLTLAKTGDEKTLKMRQVATRADLQGKGIGTRLVGFSEGWARQNDYAHFVLHAREAAVDFYKKMGYQIIGKRFEEVGIPHFKLEKAL